MKNILIFAEGKIAGRFIERINQKRVANHHYIIMSPSKPKLPEKIQVSMEGLRADPTSYSRVRVVFRSHNIQMVFILLKTLEDTGEALKNIRRIDEKILVVLLDQWNGFSKLNQNATHIIDSNEMLANRLYDFLPDVPLVAKSVGLGEGEIMEVLVPFGSTFSYRHVGSIPQIKWKITAIYRNNKLILPTNATMIRPQDTLLLVGKPQVLDNIYRRINNKDGMFPEPFGRNLYLYIDMCKDSKRALEYIEEASYLCSKLENSKLFVRIFNPTDFDILNKIKDIEIENDNIDIMAIYQDDKDSIEEIVHDLDIGLFFISIDSIDNKKLSQLHEKNKLIFVFGREKLKDIKKSIILTTNEHEMEAISSISFYVSETIKLKQCLCIYEPEGNFEDKKRIIEHYETLSHILQYPIEIEKKRVNPIRALKSMKNVLHIAPFTKELKKGGLLSRFSTKIIDHILRDNGHPKLLIPVEDA